MIYQLWTPFLRYRHTLAISKHDAVVPLRVEGHLGPVWASKRVKRLLLEIIAPMDPRKTDVPAAIVMSFRML